MSDTEQQHKVEQRLSRVEVSVENLAGSISHISNQVDIIGKRIVDSQKTPWATLASWAVVIIAVVSLGMSSYIREQGRLNEGFTLLAQRSHTSDIVSAMNGQRLDGMSREVDLFDIRIQREMRLLDDAIKEQISNLDDIIQREIHQEDNILLERIASLKHQIDILNEWMKGRDAELKVPLQSHEERLHAIEREVFGNKD